MADVTVYYDASCPLCRREIALFEGRADARFVDVSDADNVPADLSPAAAMARFHVREGEQLLSGAAAFAALWRRTPGLRTIGKVAGFPGVRHGLELGYRGFLLVRPFIQRLARGGWRAPSCR
ncbi:MAG: DUF393 domain-containing protein [Pseudomonadota bacterium]